MDDSDEQVCRLCLEKGLACACGNIEEIKKEMLEVLLISINFDKSDYAVACNRCLETIQDSFDFKLRCLTNFVQATNKVDIDEVLPWELIREDQKSLANSQVCWLCMSLIEDKDFSYVTDLGAGIPLKDMITDCLPEMDLNTARETSICKPGLGSLAVYYRFMETCKKFERFWQFIVDHSIEEIDVLAIMFKSEDCIDPGKLITKNKCSDVENDVIEETGGVKDEHVEGIKCEELHIKDELDSGEERNASEPAPETEYCNGSGGNGSSKRKEQEQKSASKDVIYGLHFCPNCPYSSKWKRNVERHMLTHPDLDRQGSGELRKFKCHYCNYKAKQKHHLNRHISEIHETIKGTVYARQQCTHKTVHARDLQRLMLHEEKAFPHKCPGCGKGFREKISLDDHLLKKHDNLHHLIARNIYGCEFCTYKSTRQGNVRSHITTLKHDQKNVEKFQCDNCNYSSFQKSKLVRHLANHSNLSLHQCPSCKKGFNRKRSLDSHIVNKHKGNAALLKNITTKIHECTLCSFKTFSTTDLGRHIKSKHK